MNNGLEPQLKLILESSRSDFYRKHWGEAGLVNFANLPVVAFADLVAVPLYERLYTDTLGIIKEVEVDGLLALFRRTILDISKPVLPLSKNCVPLMLFGGGDYGIEYVHWSYEYGCLPYVGDVNNVDASLATARYFGADSLICDMSSLKTLTEKHKLPSEIRTVVIIDSKFSGLNLPKLPPSVEVSAWYSLPETGIIASVSTDNLSSGNVALTSLDYVILECLDEKLTVTRTDLPTPLIRYQTSLPCVKENKKILLSRRG